LKQPGGLGALFGKAHHAPAAAPVLLSFQMPERRPQPNGVLDPRLGISNKRSICETCGQVCNEEGSSAGMSYGALLQPQQTNWGAYLRLGLVMHVAQDVKRVSVLLQL
jgi:hypothetical protein